MSEQTLVPNHARIYLLARISVALVWIYHGLVPKIIFRDWSEMTLLHDFGVDIQYVPALLLNVGCAEIAMGTLILVNWHARWPLWATIGIMIGGLGAVARHSPAMLHAAFNPVTLNGCTLVLAVIALLAMSPRTMTGKTKN